MSNEREGAGNANPGDSVATYTDDCAGRATSVRDGAGRACEYTTYLGGEARPTRQPPPETSAPAATPRLHNCVEFRLCGSERQEQAVALPSMGAPVIVAIERVRAFLTGEGAS